LDKLDTNQTKGIQMKKEENLTYYDIFNLLEGIKASHPKLSVGQIIFYATNGQHLFQVSDQTMLDGLQKFNEELSNE